LTAPAVSVLIGVWNGAPQVGEAIQSVLSQTAADLELIVIDDDSSDATPAILKSFHDPRLRITRRARGGLTSALNAALAMARAPLVARLDADDIALPQRLERQLEYLKGHPDVGLLGTAARETDAAGQEVTIVRPPMDDAEIRRTLIRRNPFVHSSIVMRRAAVEQAGGYDEAFPVAQDYDLWMRMSRVTRMANLSDLLVIRRLLPGRVTAARESERFKAEARIRWRAVRSGAYPPWCAVWALRPLLAQALPGAARRALRGSGSRSDG
jgi:glycosyltransferase involved in cell wall biosynthesis